MNDQKQVSPAEEVEVQEVETENTTEEAVTITADDKVEEIRKLYDEKFETLKSQLKGQDKKNSELMKRLKEIEGEKLTEAEKLEMQKKEMQSEWQGLYKERAIAKYNLMTDYEDNIDFKSYISGKTEDEIYSQAEALRKYIDSQINKGIEKGVDERFKTSTKPQASTVTGAKGNDISKMETEELRDYARRVAKMPDGEDKKKLLNELMIENNKRIIGG